MNMNLLYEQIGNQIKVSLRCNGEIRPIALVTDCNGALLIEIPEAINFDTVGSIIRQVEQIFDRHFSDYEVLG
jgi:hypothetical protein